MAAKFRNGGQTCVSPNRVYVQAGVYDAFAQKLAARVAALKVAPASDPAAQIGPMINARAVDKIARHVGDAVERGARVLTGGKRLTELGANFYAPTVLADASADMQLTCEETFGPVAALFRFDTEDEAVDAANDTPFGARRVFLHAGRAAHRARVGEARNGHRRDQRRRTRERGRAVRRREGIGLRSRRFALWGRRLPVDQVSVSGRAGLTGRARAVREGGLALPGLKACVDIGTDRFL